MWGSTGIAVNTDEISKDNVRSWQDLWKPEFKGKLLLQDDLREVFHMALRIKGFSGNTTDPKEIGAGLSAAQRPDAQCAFVQLRLPETALFTGRGQHRHDLER